MENISKKTEISAQKRKKLFVKYQKLSRCSDEKERDKIKDSIQKYLIKIAKQNHSLPLEYVKKYGASYPLIRCMENLLSVNLCTQKYYDQFKTAICVFSQYRLLKNSSK